MGPNVGDLEFLIDFKGPCGFDQIPSFIRKAGELGTVSPCCSSLSVSLEFVFLFS